MLDHINAVATSPFMIGVMILLTNVASRYIVHEFSSNEDEYSQNILLRRLAVFAVCFVGTRDLIVSILLTAGFVVLAGGLFRGTSSFSREGMRNRKRNMFRDIAGLRHVDQPAYDEKTEPMFP